MNFDEIIKKMKAAVEGVRKAIYGVEVREYIAQGLENVLAVGQVTVDAAKAAKTSETHAKASEEAAKKYAGDAAAIANTDKTLTVANAAADAAATGVRIKLLEMTQGADVNGISFVSAFDTLDGVELTGVWNKAASRIDF